MTVSDFILNRLAEWGVKRIYGYPGDGINGLLGALEKKKDKIDFIQVSHEELAAFMACGYAKFTNDVGVCMATSGPGAIHLLNGLYDAKMDHQPVVAIVGQQSRLAMGGSYQQEVDLLNLFKDVASEYCQMATEPSQVRQLIDRAMRIAKAERTVTCVIIPSDLQEENAEEKPPRKHGSIYTGTGHSKSFVLPIESEIRRAADVLNEGKKVAMLIGAGAFNAAEEVLKVADILGAGIAKALLGKAVLADDIPNVTGAIGLLGTKPSWNLMSECDTLLMIGSSFPYSEFLPKEGKARGVQIDIDARNLSIRYPMEVNLHGDSKETLRELIPYLKQKNDRSWQERIMKDVRDWWKLMEALAMSDAKPLNPQRVFWDLSPRLPDNCIITADSGTVAAWYARDIKIRKGMRASLSGNLATMCPAIPYAIAAKFAFPDRAAIALVGDGAMQMLGINSLITIAKFWKKWNNPQLIILVLNNGDLNMVSWEQRVLSGNPKFIASQALVEFPYASYAESLGLGGVRVDKPDDVIPGWEAALAYERPVVFEAVVDPAVPIIPPHVTTDQMKNFAKVLLKGDPEEIQIIRNTYKEVIKSILH